MRFRPAPRRLLGLCLVALLAVLAPPALAQAPRPVGWLGISIAEVGEEMADRLATTFGYTAGTGVFVADVLKDGPAERGALKRGDVIVRLDAQPIWDVRQLQRMIRARPVESPIALTVLRDAARIRLELTVGAMPAEARAQLAGERFGFLVREERLREPRAGPPAIPGRLVVGFVEPGSAAARAGLKPLDVLLEVNREPVRSLEAFERLVGAATRRLGLLIERPGTADPLPLDLELNPS